MRIDITGYVTEPFVNYFFTIKVTSDRVEHPSLSFSDIQVEKEVTIFIPPGFCPSEHYTEFKTTEESGSHRDMINKCLSLGRALRMGDHVKCSVFIVESETRNGDTTHNINNNRKDVETYADFPLWLYPNDDYFKRLEVDSQKSLKFRKQWWYTCINRGKYEKITDYPFGNYWWMNKNPKMIFPILWWIRFRTAISKLSKKQNIVGIVGIVVSIIGVLVTIWLSRR